MLFIYVKAPMHINSHTKFQLEFSKFQFSTVRTVKRVELHHYAKFCRNRSNRGRDIRQVNIMPKYPYHKKLQHFVLWWFYVRLGSVDNKLKVGHNWSMGRCPISKMIFVNLHVTFSVCRLSVVCNVGAPYSAG